MTRKGWWRAGTNESLRLDQTLLQALQTTQAVCSQHAKQISIRGITGGAQHTRAFAHLEKKQKEYKTARQRIRRNVRIIAIVAHLDQLLLEESSKVRMASCCCELTDHHSVVIKKKYNINNKQNDLGRICISYQEHKSHLTLPPNAASKSQPGSLWESSHSLRKP